MHVCMECYEPFDKRFLSPIDYEEYVCPRNNCQGDVVELDELIAPTIILLNQKGYITKYCCSGHWYEKYATPYIYFYNECTPESEYTLPSEFKWDDNKEERNTLRARYEPNENETKYDWVIRVNKELYKWARELPEIDY